MVPMLSTPSEKIQFDHTNMVIGYSEDQYRVGIVHKAKLCYA